MWWHVLWWTFREKLITYDFSRCITFIRNVSVILSICMLTHTRKVHFSYNKPLNHGKPRGKKGVGVSPETLVPASIKKMFPHGAKDPSGTGSPHYWGFTTTLNHARTHTHTHTLSKTPLKGWLTRRGDLYLTTRNIHKRQTYTSPARFEPANSATEQPQTHGLDWVATGIGFYQTTRR